MAVQVAALLGARRIVAAGRDAERLERLPELGATETILLGEPAGDVDVVLDYLWGEPAAAAMGTLIRERADRRKPLTWIEIGSVAGPTAAIPSAALRAARLQIVGSGQGSVDTRDILAELPALAEEITKGSFAVDARRMTLSEVERAWAAETGERIVLTPA